MIRQWWCRYSIGRRSSVDQQVQRTRIASMCLSGRICAAFDSKPWKWHMGSLQKVRACSFVVCSYVSDLNNRKQFWWLSYKNKANNSLFIIAPFVCVGSRLCLVLVLLRSVLSVLSFAVISPRKRELVGYNYCVVAVVWLLLVGVFFPWCHGLVWGL